MWALARGTPEAREVERIPDGGPLIVVANHYQRRGLWIAWAAALIGAAVARRRHDSVAWLTLGELRLLQWRNEGPAIPGSQLVLSRVARTYGFIPLPTGHVERRVAGVKTALHLVEQGGVVGFFPEGAAGRSDELGLPVKGADRLLRLLSRTGAALQPVGVYEDDGRLVARFGPALTGDQSGDSVMAAIAALLPADMRGRYR